MGILNKKNDYGLFEIRLESIGGLGANLAGKMLAEAGVLGQGLNGVHFSSYGSEKKGSPVKSFIRFSDGGRDIRINSPIEEPHVIGIFHETLYKMLDVVKGIKSDGIVLVNTTREFDDVRKDLQLKEGTLAIVDALSISVEEKTKVNTAMLGALFKIVDFLDPEVMKNVIIKTFSEKYPHLVESNIRTFERGYNEVKFKTYSSKDILEMQERRFRDINLGYKTQKAGGIINVISNSEEKDLSGSRNGFLPSLDLEKCINCSQCELVCPDFCFVWKEEKDDKGRLQMNLKGIDYQYCKGCLKCVEACPVSALTSLREFKGYASLNRVSKKE